MINNVKRCLEFAVDLTRLGAVGGASLAAPLAAPAPAALAAPAAPAALTAPAPMAVATTSKPQAVVLTTGTAREPKRCRSASDIAAAKRQKREEKAAKVNKTAVR